MMKAFYAHKISKNTIFYENLIAVEEFEALGLSAFLKQCKWFRTVTSLTPSVYEVIYEFYANLLYNISNASHLFYHRVYFRKSIIGFSPSIIWEYL